MICQNPLEAYIVEVLPGCVLCTQMLRSYASKPGNAHRASAVRSNIEQRGYASRIDAPSVRLSLRFVR